MDEPQEGREPEREEGRPFDRHLLEYVRDPALWPVLAAALAVAVTLLAAALLFAWRAGSLFALTAVVLLVLATVFAVEPDLRQRRLGPGARILLGVWAASAAAAALAVRLGAF